MATRAFLLCGDEKAVQAVTQIMDELGISFEHSSEPAFSLKRLATQRFDLLVVDCDNVQNATQVFNSARASHLNKNSIAIAIVEGKAGVPNAFRLGASLVLTKPVSLEQARNTLRTGVGMSRKEGAEVKPAAAAAASPVSSAAPTAMPAAATSTQTVPTTPAAQVRPPAAPAVLTPVAPAAPAPSTSRPVETPKPAVAPPVSEKPAIVPKPIAAPAPAEHKPGLTNFTDAKTRPNPTPTPIAKAATASVGAPSSSKNFDSIFATPAAGDKDAKAAEKDTKTKDSATKPAKDHNKESAKDSAAPKLSIVDPLAEEDALDPIRDHGVPSFGAMGKEPFAGVEKSERGGKGWLISAIVVLVLAIGGYSAWLTVPGFHKFVAGEYLNVMTKISGTPEETQAAATTPAPVPESSAPESVNPAAPTTEIDQSQAATNSATNIADSNASNQPPSAATPENEPQKTASVQTAKQNTTHPGTNPALVHTSGSVPATAATKPPSNDLLEVSEEFADDQIVHRVHPTYPKQARARKLHGTVVLQAIVNKQGKVDSLQLISGDPMLAQAAADAVKQWRYKPYSHNGEPTDFQTRVSVEFKAQ
jgi:protein TonB